MGQFALAFEVRLEVKIFLGPVEEAKGDLGGNLGIFQESEEERWG